MSSSPAWKNPRDRQKHVKRKSNRMLVLSQPSPSSDFNTESCPPMTAAPAAGPANPFKIRSPTKKKVRVEEEAPLKELTFDWDDSTANDSFSTAATSKMQQATDSPRLARSKSMQVFGEYSLDFSDMGAVFSSSAASSFANSPAVPETKTATTLPLDFRLGTKLRVTSKVPFPWMKNTKSTGNVLVRMSGEERSQGMQCFMDFPEELPCLQTVATPLNPTALLEAASFYWQYPSLPWLSLYPRAESLLKNAPKQSAPPLAPTMTDLINKQWFDSLSQLFISWKKGVRKSFYVVCPSFTVFFNKTSQLLHDGEPDEESVSCFQVANGRRHVAIISPTNLGFRQYLKSEGVSFELCSYKRRRLSRMRTEEPSENADSSRMSAGFDLASETRDGPETSETSAAAGNDENSRPPAGSDHEEESPTKGTNGVQEWLEDIGVSPRNQLKLKRHKSMISTVTTHQAKGVQAKDADRDVTSAVIITEGASLQSLFNMLQNSKVTRSIAGRHANLPPTLIASKPFLFSQLLALNKTSQVLKRQGQSAEYVLEMDGGPVLPHNVEILSRFIRAANLVAKDEATLRVNDKQAYAGLNGIDQSAEWQEIRVEADQFSWQMR